MAGERTNPYYRQMLAMEGVKPANIEYIMGANDRAEAMRRYGELSRAQELLTAEAMMIRAQRGGD